MEDRWLSVDEIGNYLGIKRDIVYKWMSEKDMPAHEITRPWKFKKERLDKWQQKPVVREYLLRRYRRKTDV